MNSFDKTDKKASLDALFPIIEEKLKSGGSITFKPRGISMLPLLRQGKDSVTVSPVKNSPQINDVIFYRRTDGQFVLHRIVGKDSLGYVLCGDNQRILESGVKEEWIIGIMTAICRKEKLIPVECKKYGFYVKAVLPMWRIWLKIRHFLGNIKRKFAK